MKQRVYLAFIVLLLNGPGLAAECWQLDMKMNYPSKFGHNDIRWLGLFNVTGENKLVGEGFGEIRHAGPCVKLKGGVSRFEFDIGGEKVDSEGEQKFVFDIEDFENPDTALDPNAPFACVLIGPVEAIGMWLQGGFYPETLWHPARETRAENGSKGLRLRNQAGVDLIVNVSSRDCADRLPVGILVCEDSEELCCDDDDDACKKLAEAYDWQMGDWKKRASSASSERE